MTGFQYDEWVYDEIARCARGMLPPGIPFKRAAKQEDVGGVDVHYIVNHAVDLQLRARFNRPAWAADCDVTFRTTEPAMMAFGTYAPLGLFVWFVKQHIVAAKLIDIYRMYDRIDPPLQQRVAFRNGDGTGFYSVEIAELHHVGALLRIFDGTVWATAILGGEVRLNRILQSGQAATG